MWSALNAIADSATAASANLQSPGVFNLDALRDEAHGEEAKAEDAPPRDSARGANGAGGVARVDAADFSFETPVRKGKPAAVQKQVIENTKLSALKDDFLGKLVWGAVH